MVEWVKQWVNDEEEILLILFSRWLTQLMLLKTDIQVWCVWIVNKFARTNEAS